MNAAADSYVPPEQQARQRIDEMLVAVGWVVQDNKAVNLLESRSEVDDRRDRDVVLDQMRVLGGTPPLSYQWQTKQEPLIWIADAIGGAVREHLLGAEPIWYEPIRAITDLRIEYRSTS